MHQLMDLSPCIAFCHEQSLHWRGRPTAPHLWSIEPIIERIKVFLRQVELRKLGKGSQTHQQGVSEHQVQSLQLTPSGWCCPFFFLFSFSQPSTEIFLRVLIGLSPSSGRALMMYLEWINPISPLLQNLYWRRKRASLPWSRYCGLGMPHLAVNSFSSWGRSHRTSLKESDLEGPGLGVANTDGCV